MTQYDLNEIVDQRRDAVGTDGDDVTFTFAGTEFHMPHPLFMDDDAKDELDGITSDVDLAIHMLGEEQYASFRALGGRATYVGLLLLKIRRDSQDTDPDGRPTRRSTSSRAARKRQKRT